MTITQLTPTRLKTLIRSAVREEIRDLFDDPDIGLKVRPEILKLLKKSREDVRRGRVVPAEEIFKKYGL